MIIKPMRHSTKSYICMHLALLDERRICKISLDWGVIAELQVRKARCFRRN